MAIFCFHTGIEKFLLKGNNGDLNCVKRVTDLNVLKWLFICMYATVSVFSHL